MSIEKPTYEMLEAKVKMFEESMLEIDFLKGKIELNRSFLEMLFDAIPSPIFYKDKEGIYKNCNDAFSKNILGISKKDIIGKSLYDFPEKIPKKNADIYYKKDNELLEKAGVQFYTSDVKCSDGITRHYNFYKATFVSDTDEALGIVGIMMDITDLQEKEKELKLLASIDPLTKLFNRRHFSEIGGVLFNLTKRENLNLSVLMLDIDKFKNINDTYGHKIGDDVLVALSDKLQMINRKSDLISRWGGEEFVILLPKTSLDGASFIAERIRKEVEKLIIDTDNKEVRFTASIGISEYKNEDINLQDIVCRADTALYKAKNSGRNKVCI